MRTTIVAMLILFVGNLSAYGRGEEERLPRIMDLDISVNWKWAGCTAGGYYPIRIQVKNSGTARTLTFQFGDRAADPPDEVAVTKRTVLCESEKTTSLILLVPIAQATKRTTGSLFVTENGERIDGAELLIQLPEAQIRGNTVSILVVSRTAESRIASNTIEDILQVRGMIDDLETVDPEELPTTWLAYTGLDIVTVDFKTFTKLSERTRLALIKWVECGGNLVIQTVEADDLKQLNQLMQWQERFAKSDYRQFIGPPAGAKLPAGGPPLSRIIMQVRNMMYGKTLVVGKGSNSKAAIIRRWATIIDSLMAFPMRKASRTPDPTRPVTTPRPPLVFADSSAKSSAQTQPNRLQWCQRNGFMSVVGHRQFTDFLIPGVKSVPVMSFLTLITLFTLLIGPVNYLWLWKKRQLNLLLVTVPALAFCTSVVLFGYSAVQHGFGVKSRIRSLTLVDQGTQSAVTHSRHSLFAGMNPSLALNFSPQTAVFPIWPTDQSYEQGDVDWTDTQTMNNGWLRARTRTQFFTVSHKSEKGRLTIKKNASETIAANGFEWALKVLAVYDTDSQGNQIMLTASDVPAGGEVTLLPANSTEDLAMFRELMQQFPVEEREKQKNGIPNEVLEMKPRRRRGWRLGGKLEPKAADVNFKSSIMEHRMATLEILSSTTTGQPSGQYMAIVDQNPDVEIGVQNTDEQAGLHVLVGRFKASEAK